jgi:hypothetical protein
MEIVSRVHPPDEQEVQGQKLLQLRPGRVPFHPKGPRQKTVCSLGSLEPAPRAQWLALALRIEPALSGQLPLVPDEDTRARAVAEQVRTRRARARAPRAQPPDGQRLIAIDPARVAVEEAREAGPVYVGHQMWRELGLSQILARAGLALSAPAY